MNICVIRLDHLGDLILTTPLIRALAKAGHAVDVVAGAYTVPALDHNPSIREAFAIEEIAPAFPRHWTVLGKWLRRRRYDAILMPHARPRELLFASAVSGASRRIAMWGGIWGRLTGHTCLRSRLIEAPRHMSDIWLDCARVLGVEPDGLVPDLFVTEEEKAGMRGALRARFGSRKIVVIHPGCGGNTCNLPDAEYAGLAALLASREECGIVITGSPRERTAYEKWPAAALVPDRIWLSAGELTLRQLIALIGESDLLVCVGTGPLHIASALHRKTLSPFCPHVGVCPRVWGNLGGDAEVIEPSADQCPRIRRNLAGHCQFEGVIDGNTLFSRVDVKPE